MDAEKGKRKGQGERRESAAKVGARREIGRAAGGCMSNCYDFFSFLFFLYHHLLKKLAGWQYGGGGR
jgi:hypothetical protein